MKKSITRSIAFITTLFMIVMITPFTLKEMIVSAASGPSNKSSNIAYTSTTLTWSGFNKTTPITISVSNSSMITDYSFNGNDTFTIRVSQNNSSSSRTGYVYAKRSGKTVAKYTIIQAGKSHTHSWSNWVTSKEPGCTTTGSKYRTCYCGAKETQMIYPKGHYMQTLEHTDATCEKPATILMKCKYCDYHFTTTIGKAKGHNYIPYNNNDVVDVECSRCGNPVKTNASYKDFLQVSNRVDDNTSKHLYLRAIYKNTSVTDSDMLDMILYMNGYNQAAIPTKVQLFCESFKEASGTLSKYKSVFNMFGIDKFDKLDNFCSYVNTGIECYEFLNQSRGSNVSAWISYMNTFKSLVQYAGNADLFYSQILDQILPYLEGTMKLLEKAKAKTYLYAIADKIIEKTNNYEDVYIDPMSVLTNMNEWLGYCISINQNKNGKVSRAYIDMYNTFYNSTIAYQKYRTSVKDRNLNDYLDFITDSGIYLNRYFGQ